MLDDALCLLLGQEVPDAEAVKCLGAVVAQVVQQVKVKVTRAGALQRGRQHGARFFSGLGARPRRQLGRQLIAFARIAIHQRRLDRLLALSVQIAVSGVKVGEALGKEEIDHLLGLLNIHIIADHRQTHQAEAQLFDVLSQISHVRHFFTDILLKVYTWSELHCQQHRIKIIFYRFPRNFRAFRSVQ